MSKPEEQLQLMVSPSTASNPRNTEAIEALANLSILDIKEDFRAELHKHVMKPFDIKTPPEKVKKRPDGYDYVEGSYMDFQTKSHIPLYEYKLLHIAIENGWINIIVSLKDRITGNVELGADSARIQVKTGTEVPNFRDIIDMGNNLKSALSKAIKNAQSRFGVSADIYGRRESVPTEEERVRYEKMSKDIYEISPTRAQIFKDQWAGLGTDWSEFLDKWQVYINRNAK